MPGRTVESNNFYLDDTATSLTDAGENGIGWHVIWTRSNFEKIVADQLIAKEYEIFLPMVKHWSVRQRRSAVAAGPESRPQQAIPMFKSYLFVRSVIDKAAYLEISNTRGVAHLLGVRWNRLARIPEKEIESIKIMSRSDLPLLPYPYLKPGARVRITRGALANATGIFVRSDSSKGLFVISVALLQRSFAVHVDCLDVVPA